MDFNGLIAGLGAHIGRPGLAADGNGECLLVSGSVRLVFTALRDGAACRICADIGPAPRKNTAAFYRSVLEANARFAAAEGPVLACSAETGRLLLSRCDSAADMTEKRFLHTVGHFIGTAELWQNLLADNEGIRRETSVADSEDSVPFHGFPESGMLGV